MKLPWYAVYEYSMRNFRNEKGTGAEICPAVISGIVTGDASVSYWPMFFRKSSNNKYQDQVL